MWLWVTAAGAFGAGPVTAADRRFDLALAQQVRKDSLERGDPSWMSDFHYADTADMTEQERLLSRKFVFAGLVILLLGVGLMYGWWILLRHAHLL